MRRRQAFAVNPPASIPTEFEPINQAAAPEVAPRRRLVLAKEFDTAVDIGARMVEQLGGAPEVIDPGEPEAQAPPRKKPVKKSKNQQSA